MYSCDSNTNSGMNRTSESTCVISYVPSAGAFRVQMLPAVRDVVDQIPNQLPLHLAARLRHVDPQHSDRFEREFQTPNVTTKNRGRGQLAERLGVGLGLRRPFQIGNSVEDFDDVVGARRLSACSLGAIVISTPGAKWAKRCRGTFGHGCPRRRFRCRRFRGRQLCRGCLRWRFGLCVGSRTGSQARRLRLHRGRRNGLCPNRPIFSGRKGATHGPAVTRTVAATNKGHAKRNIAA